MTMTMMQDQIKGGSGDVHLSAQHFQGKQRQRPLQKTSQSFFLWVTLVLLALLSDTTKWMTGSTNTHIYCQAFVVLDRHHLPQGSRLSPPKTIQSSVLSPVLQPTTRQKSSTPLLILWARSQRRPAAASASSSSSSSTAPRSSFLPSEEDEFESKWFPRPTSTTLSHSSTSATKKRKRVVDDDDIFGLFSDDDDEDEEDEEEYSSLDSFLSEAEADDADDADVEGKGIALLAKLIRHKLNMTAPGSSTLLDDADEDKENIPPPTTVLQSVVSPTSFMHLVKGRFMDLTCTKQGEHALEKLFLEPLEMAETDNTLDKDDNVIRAAVMAVQSLVILGTQLGVKGSPAQLQRMIAHLKDAYTVSPMSFDELQHRDVFDKWDTDSVRRLKYQLDRRPAMDLLAALNWKRSTQGAFDLLVALRAWDKHEDIALIRSGFSIRFHPDELEAADTASHSTRDADEILGLRQDLRHIKVFTVDSADTSEIDDGISLEPIGGTDRQRIWIHIADAERWSPRNSQLYDVARQRITSLYLPQGPIPMLPPKASDDIMSLTMNKDSYALSLGVELNEDGSIDESSILVTPSQIRVTYRLTYDEVDEMLDEGIGHQEEWELGALLNLATQRRQYRINHGSSEGFVPTPIPQKSISIQKVDDNDNYDDDDQALDGWKINVKVQATHNSGTNQSAGAQTEGGDDDHEHHDVEPVSSAFTLVTEMMILAGEAIGRWKLLQDKLQDDNDNSESDMSFRNHVRLPFRTQRKPDYTSRSRERHVMNSLLEYNIGGGYCFAWYCRRFLQSVKVQEQCAPHSGLGLKAYCQWTSPIRRYSDMMVHISVKRYLRRQRLQELLQHPPENMAEVVNALESEDIGCPLPTKNNDNNNNYSWTDAMLLLDTDLDFAEGAGLVGAARMLQRNSEEYWLLEYIRRIHAANPDKTWNAMVLGYVGSSSGGELQGPQSTAKNQKQQYAIYIYELGFEYKYSAPPNNHYKLNSGLILKLKVSLVNPRAGLLQFVRTNV